MGGAVRARNAPISSITYVETESRHSPAFLAEPRLPPCALGIINMYMYADDIQERFGQSSGSSSGLASGSDRFMGHSNEVQRTILP